MGQSFDASFRLFEWAGLSRYDDVDIDEVDFRDPYPNPEELILAMESAVGRGLWSFGIPREEEPTLKADRDARRKYRRKPPAP